MKREKLTRENTMELYKAIEEYVWEIADQIRLKLYGHRCPKQIEWEYLRGEIYAKFRSDRSMCSCGGCGDFDYVSVDFPAKLLGETEDGVKAYLETIKVDDGGESNEG